MILLPQSIHALWAILLLIATAHGQFQFFENMFGGGQQHQFHEQQDVASDSSWYQRTWDGGECENCLPAFSFLA